MKSYSRYNKYKDSKVNWLGNIPDSWEVKKTKYLFSLKTDASLDDHGMELLSVYTDIGVKPRKELEAKGNKATSTDGYWIVKKNDIVVNKLLAWMGAIGYSNYDGVTSPAYDILRPMPSVSSKFYGYLFRTKLFSSEMKRYSRGIMDMRLRLYFSEFGNIPLPVPPESEMAEILEYLENEVSRLDSLIVKHQEIIQLLKEKRQAVITQATTKGINNKVKFKDSNIKWIGSIPNHWEIKQLKFVADVIPSNVDKKEVVGESRVLLCNYVDVYRNEEITKHLDFMTATATDDQLIKFRLTGGDVIITKDSESPFDIGIPAYVPLDIDDVICGYHLAIIRMKNKMYSDFLRRVIQSDYLKYYFSINANGLTRYGLGSYSIKNILIPIPPEAEALEISSYLKVYTQKIDTLIKQSSDSIKKLNEKKISLITNIVTGKIKVSK